MKDNLYILKQKNIDGNTLFTAFQKDRDPFKVRGQGLYAWTYRRDYDKMLEEAREVDDDIEEVTGRLIKFGQYGANAANGSLPHETIASYVGITTDEIVILWAKRFSDKDIEANGSALQVEQVVNKRIGLKNNKGRSTEVFNTKINIIKTEANNVLYGISKKESYNPRLRQQQAIDKMVAAYNNSNKNFLLGAVMRFGKNFTFLNFAKNICKPGDVVVVITNKPGVFSTLEVDIKTHVSFNDFCFIKLVDVGDRSNVYIDSAKVNVIAISKQLADNVASGKTVCEFIKRCNIKLAFYDECHSGTNTENFKQLLKKVDADFNVWASGTPWKTLVCRNFSNDCTYFYDYVMQQLDKKQDIEQGIPNDAVTLCTYIIDVPAEIATNPNYTEDENFTLTKLLGFRSKKFVYAGEVQQFFENILGKSTCKSKYSPYRIIDNLNHTVWLLPEDSKMIVAASKLIQSIVGEEYFVIAATGNKTRDIRDVHQAIDQHDRTITLTCKRFIEGTTVPEWNAALVLCDTESVEKYFQFVFRVASPAPEKEHAYIFDFDSARTFDMAFELANNSAIRDDDTNIAQVQRVWLDNWNIMRAGDGPEFEPIDVIDILNQISNYDFRATKLIRQALEYINIDMLDSNSIEFIRGLVGTNKVKNAKVRIGNGVTQKGKNKKIIANGDRSSSNVSIDNDIEQTIEKIAIIIAALPLVADVTGNATVENIIKNCSEETLQSSIRVDKPTLEYLVDHNIVDTRYVNIHL